MFLLTSVSFGQTIISPDNRLMLEFGLNDEKAPVYRLSFKNKAVVKESKLGFELQNAPH